MYSSRQRQGHLGERSVLGFFLRGYLGDRALADRREIIVLGIIPRLRILVAGLDEQPGFFAAEARRADQGERALQLLPVEAELQGGILKGLARDLLSLRPVRALLPDALADLDLRVVGTLVPDHHGSRPVSCWEHPFEAPILHIVVGRG